MTVIIISPRDYKPTYKILLAFNFEQFLVTRRNKNPT